MPPLVYFPTIRVPQLQVMPSTGPQGPIGPPGAYALFTQAVATTVWDIQHNLGFWINVMLLDDDDEQYHARIVQDTINHLFVYHNSPKSGKAVLS